MRFTPSLHLSPAQCNVRPLPTTLSESTYYLSLSHYSAGLYLVFISICCYIINLFLYFLSDWNLHSNNLHEGKDFIICFSLLFL